ncbi:MAG: amidohydrolase family protein [Novosphingobium sp.]|nr:amidohydrolase family protein [Novosphingobium sp.]
MLDLLIRDACLIDGTGAPARNADIGVKDGRIAAIGSISDSASRTIDADGRVLAPGFVDIHTHYDAQVFWDPTLSPSCMHGVTSVITGNCGFSIAPLSQDAAPYLLRMLARVEGMPEASLEAGVPWNWESFADYLDRLEGRVGLNIGVMCGHSAIRRTVMGKRGQTEQAGREDLERMKSVLAESLAAGAMGFSSTISTTHNDADGNPVPSRAASREELIALAGVCRDFPGTSLEFLPGIDPFDEPLMELMTQMSLAAERALNWNAIGAQPGNEALVENQLSATNYARKRGGEIIGLTLAANATVRLNLYSGFFFDSMPGWEGVFRLPVAERIELFKDPERRKELEAGPARMTGTGAGIARFERYVVSDSSNSALVDQTLGDIAAREGKRVIDVMLDTAIADELRTVFSIQGAAADRDLWKRRGQIWQDDRAMIGASDAGAHLDMIDTFHYTSYLLGVARDQDVITLEEAVHQLTGRPAEYIGLTERGQVKEGWHADLTLFDPETVAERQTQVRHDLPGGEMRLYGDAEGISHVLVNGQVIVEGGEHTGALPGKVLRSGRDTHTYRPKSFDKVAAVA